MKKRKKVWVWQGYALKSKCIRWKKYNGGLFPVLEFSETVFPEHCELSIGREKVRITVEAID